MEREFCCDLFVGSITDLELFLGSGHRSGAHLGSLLGSVIKCCITMISNVLNLRCTTINALRLAGVNIFRIRACNL